MTKAEREFHEQALEVVKYFREYMEAPDDDPVRGDGIRRDAKKDYYYNLELLDGLYDAVRNAPPAKVVEVEIVHDGYYRGVSENAFPKESTDITYFLAGHHAPPGTRLRIEVL